MRSRGNRDGINSRFARAAAAITAAIVRITDSARSKDMFIATQGWRRRSCPGAVGSDGTARLVAAIGTDAPATRWRAARGIPVTVTRS